MIPRSCAVTSWARCARTRHLAQQGGRGGQPRASRRLGRRRHGGRVQKSRGTAPPARRVFQRSYERSFSAAVPPSPDVLRESVHRSWTTITPSRSSASYTRARTAAPSGIRPARHVSIPKRPHCSEVPIHRPIALFGARHCSSSSSAASAATAPGSTLKAGARGSSFDQSGRHAKPGAARPARRFGRTSAASAAAAVAMGSERVGILGIFDELGVRPSMTTMTCAVGGRTLPTRGARRSPVVLLGLARKTRRVPADRFRMASRSCVKWRSGTRWLTQPAPGPRAGR